MDGIGELTGSVKEIYLIRHGETDYNQQGIVQGRGVDSSLNSIGRAQAQSFFERYQHTGFEKIYISHLRRTAETVARFLEMGIPVEKHTGLDEISWGVHEGKSDQESFRLFYQVLHEWQNGNITLAIQDGESPVQVQERQRVFLAKLLQDPEQRVLICSHGRAMRILLCTMLNEPLHKMDTFPHQNVCLYKLSYRDGSFMLEIINDTAHLNAE